MCAPAPSAGAHPNATEPWWCPPVFALTSPSAGDIEGSLACAEGLRGAALSLGSQSLDYLTTLATLGAVDLTTARALEPHLDAVAILAQAGWPDLSRIDADAHSTWGVYAAAAPGHGLVATGSGPGVSLSGTKAWSSLADSVSHALVTARSGEASGLFAIPLRHPGVSIDSSAWISRGLHDITTATLTLTDVPAVPIGGPGWYLSRPGFAWGGIGVAAIWFGGAAALAGALRTAASRREPDQLAQRHLGACDEILYAAWSTLVHAAREIDEGRAEGQAGAILALRVRGIVARAAEDVLSIVGHALGPFPLTQIETHARRVADLTVYIRQHHAERDQAALGALLLAPPS